MKKTLILFLLTLLSFLSAYSQTTQNGATTSSLTPEQTKSLEEILKLNDQLAKFYVAKNYTDAMMVGKNILVIAEKTDIKTDIRFLTSLGNVGEVFLANKKETEAIAVFQRVADEYEKIGDKGRAPLEKITARLMGIYSAKEDLKNAEAKALKLLALRENLYGANSAQLAESNTQLGKIYQAQGKREKAEPYYLKAVEINDVLLKDKDMDERTDIDNYTCFLYHTNFSGASVKIKEFSRKRRGSESQQDGIVNGKALKLITPPYPQMAKSKGLTGFAIVRVDIDEQGNVTKARTYCGFLDFVKESESAALKSKFTPTLLDGVPVKVTGDIVYNFGGR